MYMNIFYAWMDGYFGNLKIDFLRFCASISFFKKNWIKVSVVVEVMPV